MTESRRAAYRPVRHSRILMRIAAALVVVIALTAALAMVYRQEQQMESIRTRSQALAEQQKEIDAVKQELLELKQIAGTPAYFERIARDKLGMVKPDEVVFENR